MGPVTAHLRIVLSGMMFCVCGSIHPPYPRSASVAVCLQRGQVNVDAIVWVSSEERKYLRVAHESAFLRQRIMSSLELVPQSAHAYAMLLRWSIDRTLIGSNVFEIRPRRT